LHLAGFTIEIYYDARPYECHIISVVCVCVCACVCVFFCVGFSFEMIIYYMLRVCSFDTLGQTRNTSKVHMTVRDLRLFGLPSSMKIVLLIAYLATSILSLLDRASS